MKKTSALLALLLAAVLTLAACGGGSDGKTAAVSHDKADVAFAQGMIPHHRQAVTMATLAEKRAASPQVKALARRIAGAQGPEITTMSRWLKAWGQTVPSGSMGAMSGRMPGMMSDAQMGRLAASSGATFDQMFLTLMVAHHTGAVAMARTEQAGGQDPDAIALAKRIQAAQTREINTMKQLLGV